MVFSMRRPESPGVVTQSRCDGVGLESSRHRHSFGKSARGEGFYLLVAIGETPERRLWRHYTPFRSESYIARGLASSRSHAGLKSAALRCTAFWGDLYPEEGPRMTVYRLAENLRCNSRAGPWSKIAAIDFALKLAACPRCSFRSERHRVYRPDASRACRSVGMGLIVAEKTIRVQLPNVSTAKKYRTQRDSEILAVTRYFRFKRSYKERGP
jgi:hypothetical protein